MKTTIQIIIGVALIIYATGPVITISPLSVKFERPFYGLALLLLILSLICFIHDSYKKGSRDTINAVLEIIEEQKNKPKKHE